MWWALLWATIIANVGSVEYGGTAAWIIAFLVIWWFAADAKAAQNYVKKHVLPKVEEDIWTK